MPNLSYEKLTSQQIEEELLTVPDWTVEKGALTRSWKFENYNEGLLFALTAGVLAEKLNHHPEITIGYGKVSTTLVTHDADGGLTQYDFEYARQLDRMGC